MFTWGHSIFSLNMSSLCWGGIVLFAPGIPISSLNKQGFAEGVLHFFQTPQWGWTDIDSRYSTPLDTGVLLLNIYTCEKCWCSDPFRYCSHDCQILVNTVLVSDWFETDIGPCFSLRSEESDPVTSIKLGKTHVRKSWLVLLLLLRKWHKFC